jgi:hypothetical protein
MHILTGPKHAQQVRKENKLQKQSSLTKHHINISQATQQRHPYPNRKHTTATVILVTVANLVCQATVVVTVAIPSDPVGRKRAREAEQEQSSDMRWCWLGGSYGRTDRDTVPSS